MRVASTAVAAALCVAAIAITACGDESDGAALTDATSGNAVTEKQQAATAPQRSAGGASNVPAALRANKSDADTLAGEGEDGLKARLAKLRGHPVVVNQWASWCPPCRAEFPLFADAAEEHGDRVAFLGLDFTDDRDAANDLLKEKPPGFASIFDPDGDATRSLGGGRISPTTFFVGTDGKVVYTKLGNYVDAKTLEADIQRYALSEQ